jgi:FlaA1/EpsC-like NDP-sugar epimerase
MSIPEAVNLVIHAACLTEGDDIFVLKMGEVVRIVDIAERMLRLRGLRPYEDIKIEFTGVRPGEKMHEELHDEAEDPIPTIHPHIIKLNRWQVSLDPHSYFQRLDYLCCNGFVNRVDIMEQFKEMTGAISDPVIMRGSS